MPEFLEVTVDKFTFKVATDRWYTREGLWVLPSSLTPLPASEGNQRVRVGLSDFLQQRSGDMAFAEIKPVGTVFIALADADGCMVFCHHFSGSREEVREAAADTALRLLEDRLNSTVPFEGIA